MKLGNVFLFFLAMTLCTCHMTEEEIAKSVDERIITCGSALRIQNVMTKFHLHSHKLTWGSGSHQQSITAVQTHDDPNSLWIVKEAQGEVSCESGSAILCGSNIRLEHANTGKNLHSHEYASFITDSQEASGFGDNGEGDVNDNFQIICKDSNSKVLKGSSKFQLFHKPTNSYVYINIRKSLFNEYNCRGCPILGQREVSLTKTSDMQSVWKVVGGILLNEDKREE